MTEYMPYEVIDVETGLSHGPFPTLAEAHKCVEFDYIRDWEIHKNGTCIAWKQENTS